MFFKNTLCTVMSQVLHLHIIQSEISQETSKIMNFYKRSYQLILRYLYTETIKRRGEILLHRNFKGFVQGRMGELSSYSVRLEMNFTSEFNFFKQSASCLGL